MPRKFQTVTEACDATRKHTRTMIFAEVGAAPRDLLVRHHRRGLPD
jgi:hypothetical protein